MSGRFARERLERECDVNFIRTGGPGGQHKNRRDTGVRLHHRPSGLIVTATERRSRKRNIEAAFRRLAMALKALYFRPKPRKATRPGRGAKLRRLQDKRLRGKTKKLRGKPSGDD